MTFKKKILKYNTKKIELYKLKKKLNYLIFEK